MGMGYGFDTKTATETHYVAHIKVVRIEKHITPAGAGVDANRTVSDVANAVVKGNDLPKLIGKVSAHLALVEE